GISKNEKNKKIWNAKDRIASLTVESELIDLESKINKANDLLYFFNKKGRQDGLQIARRGFQVYADTEFDSVERERKRKRENENDKVEVDSPVTSHPYFHLHIPPPRFVTLSSPSNFTPICVHTSPSLGNFIARMGGVNYRLFDYRVVNLSEKNLVDLVNKVFSNDDKKKNEKIMGKNVIFEKPFEGEFNFVKHYRLLWVQDIFQRFMVLFASTFNILRDANAHEMAYRDSFVNPLIPKVFDDMIKLDSKLERSKVLYVSNKGIRQMVENLGYQSFIHLKRNATKSQLLFLQSFGVLVYQRETTIYAMHRAKGGLHIVDIITNFTIPDNKDQVYVIDEIIEKVYFFKPSNGLLLKVARNIAKVQEYSPTNENSLEASPSKRALKKIVTRLHWHVIICKNKMLYQDK
ncbi:13209_t:CDS:2, partial [Funneliformis caledonium]